jgi:hypothetical protein
MCLKFEQLVCAWHALAMFIRFVRVKKGVFVSRIRDACVYACECSAVDKKVARREVLALTTTTRAIVNCMYAYRPCWFPLFVQHSHVCDKCVMRMDRKYY